MADDYASPGALTVLVEVNKIIIRGCDSLPFGGLKVNLAKERGIDGLEMPIEEEGRWEICFHERADSGYWILVGCNKFETYFFNLTYSTSD